MKLYGEKTVYRSKKINLELEKFYFYEGYTSTKKH